MRLEPLNWPAPNELKRWARAFAMLDAILSPEWEYRYYSFNSKWSEGKEMASIRNGSGDEVFLLFTGRGCILKVFDHEAAIRTAHWKGQLTVAEALAPAEYREFFSESAFSLDDVTDVIWWDARQKKWLAALPDGNELITPELLVCLVSIHPAEEYAAWAADYYETEIPPTAVRYVVEGKSLTPEVVSHLNDVGLADLAGDIEEIGYPV